MNRVDRIKQRSNWLKEGERIVLLEGEKEKAVVMRGAVLMKSTGVGYFDVEDQVDLYTFLQDGLLFWIASEGLKDDST